MPDREIAFAGWNAAERAASLVQINPERAKIIARELPGALIGGSSGGEASPRDESSELHGDGPDDAPDDAPMTRSLDPTAAERAATLLRKRYSQGHTRGAMPGGRGAILRGESSFRGGELRFRGIDCPPGRDESSSRGDEPDDALPPATPQDRWAVLVRPEDRASAGRALSPLIEHRRKTGALWEPPENATGAPGIVEMPYPKTANVESWLERLGEATGGDPPEMLLLLGGPDVVPFEVEMQLATERAVGRLDVGDSAEGPFSWDACAAYAKKVVRYEEGAVPVQRKALLYSFSTDRATQVSHRDLVQPIEKHLRLPRTRAVLQTEDPECFYEDAATTAALCERLRGASPALVMTASHGLEFPADPGLWGALTDQSFVGSGGGTPFSAASLGRESFAAGAVFFAFACWSAGIPRRSAHRFFTQDKADDLPQSPRVSPLPRALLAHPNGPVAFVGHVDRATSASFLSSPIKSPRAFIDLVQTCLTSRATLGAAMGALRARVGPAGLQLATALSPLPGSGRSSPTAIMDAWIRFNDVLGYVLLGDPALRITFAK